MSRTAEKRVHCIALHAFEEVPTQQPITLHMADLGLHCGPAPELAFQGVAELAGAADEDAAALFGNAVAFVSFVNKGKVWSRARIESQRVV